MCYQQTVGLPTQEKPLARGDDEESPVGQPIDAQRKGPPRKDDFVVALEIDRQDLWHAPIREPKTVFVPTRLLAEHETGHQGLELRHGSALFRPSPLRSGLRWHHQDGALGEAHLPAVVVDLDAHDRVRFVRDTICAAADSDPPVTGAR